MTDLDQLKRIVAEGERLYVVATELRLDAIDSYVAGGDQAITAARFARDLAPIEAAMKALREQQQKIAARLKKGDAA